MTIGIIGGGIGGLAAACLLTKKGYKVTLYEKNEQLGGKAGVLETAGFRFDLGPSWYLMPEVFERFFTELGEKIEDHFELIKLTPSYQVTFAGYDQQVLLHSNISQDKKTFESIEPGAGEQLEAYLSRSKYIYQVAMDHFLYKNYDSVRSVLSPKFLVKALHMSLFTSMDHYVSKYFRDPRLKQIVEYPVVFLGANPYNNPAFYSLMSHVDLGQGVFYPKGGMHQVTLALERIARKHNVTIQLNSPVEQIVVENGVVQGLRVGNEVFEADVVISNADRHHTETRLLDASYRDHSDTYWRSRTLAPSALLMYLGLNKQYDNLQHHNLLFARNWSKNFRQISEDLRFPDEPSLYVCAPGKTDASVAPPGKENLFVLVPVAPQPNYSDTELRSYAEKVLQLMETELRLPGLREQVIYKKLFSVQDFTSRFNSFQGTALGLAHTLRQTALFRPASKSKKVKNLFYVGADTHPGIGIPSCLISAQLLSRRFK